MRPLVAKWDPSGQFVRKMGKSALELGGKIQSWNRRRSSDRHWRNQRKKENSRECSNIKARVSVYWRTQWHAKWPRGGKEFQHAAVIEPMLPYSLRLTLTIKPWLQTPWVCIDLQKETVYDSSLVKTLNWFLAYKIVVLKLFKLNIKARPNIPEFSTANLLSILWHFIA